MATCPNCDAPLGTDAPGWCSSCETGQRIGSAELLRWLLEDVVPLQLEELDADPLAWPGYAERRREARGATGTDEAVAAAVGRVRGSTAGAVLVAWDFRFLGGSMSSAVGRIVVAAFEHARTEGLPVVLLPSTGGARMQEGMASLVQMAATSVAAKRHAEAGLLQVAVLRDPTTGGVFASHANLADVILAEPGATIGFAGPRVAEAMTGGPLPDGSHTARGALASGLVDAVVPRPELPARLARLLGWPGSSPVAESAPGPGVAPQGRRVPAGDAWTEVERSRAEDRPRAPAFLSAMDVVAELRGDRAGTEDGTIRVALVRVAGRPAVVVAMDRTVDGARLSPAAYRKAWRGLRLASRLGVPVVTLVDTPGADASASSEAGGIAHHIARTFVELLDVTTPVVSLVIGEGGSGGALALAVGDRLLIQEHATFSVIAPEGAAAILHRDPSRAPEVAGLLRPTAKDLETLGIADEVVPEPEGVEVATARAALVRHLDELVRAGPEQRLAERHRRWAAGRRGA